jgi:hypothetical protein
MPQNMSLHRGTHPMEVSGRNSMDEAITIRITTTESVLQIEH